MLPEFTDLSQESPTLNLANDCLRFVTGFFEVISTSAPHTYHSALLLSSTTSLVWQLYEQQAKPLVKVIQGLPTAWDPSIANTRFSNHISVAMWSPYSRFIAITFHISCEVVVLDAATLGQLYTMHFQSQNINLWKKLIFSPDSYLLTAYFYEDRHIVSWDLQTGSLISNISTIG